MEADISIWHKTGHFYFALTRTRLRRPSAASSARARHSPMPRPRQAFVCSLATCPSGQYLFAPRFH